MMPPGDVIKLRIKTGLFGGSANLDSVCPAQALYLTLIRWLLTISGRFQPTKCFIACRTIQPDLPGLGGAWLKWDIDSLRRLYEVQISCRDDDDRIRFGLDSVVNPRSRAQEEMMTSRATVRCRTLGGVSLT